MNPAKTIKREAKRQVGKIKRIIKPKPKKVGLAPGTLVYTGGRTEHPIRISLIDYTADKLSETHVNNIGEIFPCLKTESVSWINLDGIHNVEIIEKIGKHFNIHPLVLEDILHTTQRPKLEEYENFIFVVVRMFLYNQETGELNNEQVCLIIGQQYLLTFQEDIGDVFDSVRERIRKGGPKIRNAGTDYLAYALIDAVVDSYFHILEQLGEEIEELEDRLVTNPDQEDLQKVYRLKRDMILLRKSVWPLREVLSQIQRIENNIIKKSTEIYFRDVYDHSFQVIDTIESYREMAVGMLDVYLSSLSNKMNEVMKVLTIIATVFIPLTFLAGVYGMNFEHFPELHWDWMYPWGFWAFTIGAISLMIWYFKKRKWL